MRRVQDVKLSYCAAADEDGARLYNTLRGGVRRGAGLIALANLGQDLLEDAEELSPKRLEGRPSLGTLSGTTSLELWAIVCMFRI